jgi:hypothetical protein
MAVEPLSPGDPGEVAGYRLRGGPGAGGLGVVYLTFMPSGRPVALTVVRPELGDDPDLRFWFRQEIEAAQRVNGLYAAQLLDSDPDGTPPRTERGRWKTGPKQRRAAHAEHPARPVRLLGHHAPDLRARRGSEVLRRSTSSQPRHIAR